MVLSCSRCTCSGAAKFHGNRYRSPLGNSSSPALREPVGSAAFCGSSQERLSFAERAKEQRTWRCHPGPGLGFGTGCGWWQQPRAHRAVPALHRCWTPLRLAGELSGLAACGAVSPSPGTAPGMVSPSCSHSRHGCGHCGTHGPFPDSRSVPRVSLRDKCSHRRGVRHT